eukprot:CAMPEP_0168509714 /NCGR_PEP_ID=MMETSP0405-20121227/965_1 /TAXON_ID=498012 /ORGANISM="Trichosphaerium sp, Strain Am-I-7 wt" /LENGTH=98 /DNA_ID=CAMNT_0008527275 /DNA_START=533 /DNA_END=829 /DNA_ORIENTATION=+
MEENVEKEQEVFLMNLKSSIYGVKAGVESHDRESIKRACLKGSQFLDEVRSSLEKWSKLLQNILTPKQSCELFIHMTEHALTLLSSNVCDVEVVLPVK